MSDGSYITTMCARVFAGISACMYAFMYKYLGMHVIHCM